MPKNGWDLSRQFTIAMVVVMIGAIASSLIAILEVRSVMASSDRVRAFYGDGVLTASKLEIAAARRSAKAREFLLTGDDAALRASRREQAAVVEALDDLRGHPHDENERRMLDAIARAEAHYATPLEHAFSLRTAGVPAATVRTAFEDEVAPAMTEIDKLLFAFTTLKARQLDDAIDASATEARRATNFVVGVSALAMVIALVLTTVLRRVMRELTRSKALVADTLTRVEQSNRDLEAFAGRVAHDVRNALGPFLMAPGVLRNPGLSPEQAERVHQRLDRAAEHAVDLVDALLAFSKATTTPENEAPASVRAVVREVVDDLQPQLAQADAMLQLELDDAEVACGAPLLRTVVANLLGNAVKFVRDRPRRRIRVDGKAVRRGFELSVTDSGPGIPADALDRIFEPFYRVPGTPTPGTGIGLATVRRIVDAHHGYVRVVSTPGEGARFVVWLPLAEAHSGAQPIASVARA